MDSLFERYLTKIGANNEEMLLSFSNAYFKDYSYIKENHLYKAKVCINDLLDPKIYINLFKYQDVFQKNGGFTSELTFSYVRESIQSVKKFIEEYINIKNLYNLNISYIGTS